MTLEVSNDGGSVYHAPLQRSLGAVGRRAQRVRWGPLGTCQAGGSRVFRLRVTDAVPLTIQRVANVERAQLLVESASRGALQRFLAAWQPLLLDGRSVPGARGLIRFAVDVDPLAI